MRVAEAHRKTRETEVYVTVKLDGEGASEVSTGISFLDHLLTTLATHSLMDLKVSSKGDLKHHTIEDVAACLGGSVREAMGEGAGINRFGWAIVPMDCSLAISAIDLARRPHSNIDLSLRGSMVEDMPCEDIYHFLETLASALQASIHILVQTGRNDHHKVEAALKALALSLRQALTVDPKGKGTPSSKGVL
ncbi:MAG: imidazoleglycerol-phosphate dehydratase HisB [Candidatus Bathyarchaeia archaeon]